MTAALSWPDILVRLGPALLAGALIGLDRGKLTVTFADAGPLEPVLLRNLHAHRFELRARQVKCTQDGVSCITCTGRYRGPYPDWSFALLDDVSTRSEVQRVVWSDIE